MTEDAFLYFGDSWYIIVAALVTLAVVVVADIFGDPRKGSSGASDTQSHRDTILFEQIEEFRRDFS